MVVVVEVGVGVEQLRLGGEVAGAVDAATHSVVAGVLGLAVEKAPHRVAAVAEQLRLGAVLAEQHVVPHRRRRIGQRRDEVLPRQCGRAVDIHSTERGDGGGQVHVGGQSIGGRPLRGEPGGFDDERHPHDLFVHTRKLGP